MSVFIPKMKIMEKLSPVLPEVTFSQNFHLNFDMVIHAEFSKNGKRHHILNCKHYHSAHEGAKNPKNLPSKTETSP